MVSDAPSSPVRRTRGLTLVEVLVAVVLCGAGLAIASLGLAAAVRADGHAGDLSRAAHHVELLLARLESDELPLEASAGDFAADGAPDLRWEVAVASTQTEGLQEVTATVRWDTPAGERDLEVVRWIFVDPEVGGVQ